MDEIEEELMELTQCSICLEMLNDPRVLPCHHSFCFNCLQNFVERSGREEGEIPCPNCRKSFTLPSNGRLEGLQKDFRYATLVEKLEKLKHQKGIKTGKGETNACDQHRNNQLEYLCADCKVIICRRCVLESHKTHDYKIIDGSIDEEVSKELEFNTNRVSVLLSHVLETGERLECKEKRFLDEAEVAEKMVNENVAGLKNLLDGHARSLISCLKEEKEKRKKEIEAEKNRLDVSGHLRAWERYKDLQDEAISRKSSFNLCMALTESHRENQRLLQAQETLPPIRSIQLSFKKSQFLDNLTNLMLTTGNIFGEIESDVDLTETSLNLMASLDTADNSVWGVTYLEDKIYAVTRRPSKFILVYRLQTPFQQLTDEKISLSQVKSPRDVAACRASKSIYVTDDGEKCVWKLCIDDRKLTRWLNGINSPYKLSVDDDGKVLLLRCDQSSSSSLDIYGSNANLLSTIPLRQVEQPTHAIASSSSKGNFIVCYGKSTDDVKGIDRITEKGEIVCRCCDDVGSSNLVDPHYLACDAHDEIFIADCMTDRVVVMDVKLNRQKVLLTKQKDGLHWPYRLCYVEERNLLIVVHKDGFSVHVYRRN